MVESDLILIAGGLYNKRINKSIRKWSDKAGIIIQGSLYCLSYACQVLATKLSGECV